MEPEFPITVTFHEDGEQWVIDTLDKVPGNLEWFDSDDPDENADVHDAKGRPVRLKVELLEVKLIELKKDGV